MKIPRKNQIQVGGARTKEGRAAILTIVDPDKVMKQADQICVKVEANQITIKIPPLVEDVLRFAAIKFNDGDVEAYWRSLVSSAVQGELDDID